MKKLVQIKLHGELGKAMGNELFNLDVKSVGEACHAIEMLTKRKYYKYLLDNDKKGQKYKILINKRKLIFNKDLDKDIMSVKETELAMKYDNLQSIDIVPVLEGAKDIIETVLGAVLIIVGIVLLATGVGAAFGVPLIIAGLGLLAGGIISLLSSPPKFADFREIDGSTGRTSYLFNGPENTTQEGGPVPLVYGNLIVGSQVVAASYLVNSYYADGSKQTVLQNTQLVDFANQYKS